VRPDLQEKIKRALDRKPTAAYINSKGLTPEEVNKLFGHNVPPKNSDKKINFKNKKKKRRKIKPRPQAVRMYPDRIPDPKTQAIDTPEWFTSKEPIDVSIIVPLFRSNKVIAKQIESWDLTEDGLSKEIIYVDDCCPYKSHVQVVDSWNERKHLLQHPVGKIFVNHANVGYGYACNIGAQHARGKYLIFLNADALVSSNWVRPIYDRFERRPKIGIIGNLQLKPDGIRIDSAGSEWSWQAEAFEHIGRHILDGSKTPEAMKLEDLPQRWKEPGEREMVTGCCFAVPRDLWINVLHGFDPTFRIGYWEDSDLNLRVRELGFKVWFEPNSVIYHSPGHSGSGGHPYMEHNKQHFFNKWVHSGKIDRYVKARRPRPLQIRSIHLQRSSAHGDVLVAASFAGALKEKHPGSKLTFSTICRDVVAYNPDIDYATYPGMSSPKKLISGYDLAYDLDRAYEYRPKQHIVEAYADALGLKPEDSRLFIHTEPPKRIELPKKYVVIHAGKTAWVGRNWHAEKLDDVAGQLKKMGYFVVVIGVARDAPLSNGDIDLRNKTNIYELAYTIKNCQHFFGIDSFPMWIAQTFKKSGVCFFGCVDPKLRLINDLIKPVNAHWMSCIGCHHEQPIPCVGTSGCKEGHLKCETEITADMFWERVCEVING